MRSFCPQDPKLYVLWVSWLTLWGICSQFLCHVPLSLIILTLLVRVWMCPPPKFIKPKSYPLYLRMWVYLELKHLKASLGWNEVMRVDPNPIWLVSLLEEIRTPERYTNRKDPVYTQGKDTHRQAKKGLWRDQPCPYLDLGLLDIRTVRK